MKYQFGNISLDIRQKIVDWILEGPIDADIKALRRAQWDKRDVEETDKQFVIEKWRLEHLSLVMQYLSGISKNIFDDLEARYGAANFEEKPRFSTSVSRGVRPALFQLTT